MGLAIVLLESKSYSESLEQLTYLRQVQPENLRVQVGLAECQHGMGNTAEAVRVVDEVLTQQPEYAPALSLRGRLELDSGHYVDAERLLRNSTRRAPGDHEARYSLILCLYQNGKAEEAKRDEQELKQWEEGVKLFNELVSREVPKRPLDPDLHFKLGQLLMRSGHQEQGLRWLHSAIRLDPNHGPARQALAEYYEKARKEQQQPGD